MNDYLFNQNIVIILSGLAGLLSWLFVRRLLRAKLSWVKLAIGSGISLALIAAEVIATSELFGLNETPVAGYYLAFLCDALLVFIVVAWKNWRAMAYGAAAFLAMVVLLGISINDYYQYYPTLGSIFGTPYSIADTTTTQSGEYRQASIESRLFSHGQSRGEVSAVAMPGKVSHFPARDGYVYLPPAYFNKGLSGQRFPVLMLLTGVPGNPSSWLQSGILVNTLNNFAAHHDGITPIVVVADQSGSFLNDTECLNSANGNAETYLTVDVPNYIKQHYRALDSPANWGIGGFSEGGMCAAMLTLTHQNVFRHFLDLSGEPNPYLNDNNQTLPVLFHGSKTAQKEHNIDWLLKNKRLFPQLTAQFAIGSTDDRKLIKEMQFTYHEAESRRIPTSFEMIAYQGHDFGAWSQGFSDALPTLSYYLGATECQAACTQ